MDWEMEFLPLLDEYVMWVRAYDQYKSAKCRQEIFDFINALLKEKNDAQ